jgi:Flp pilus assembly protein TadG
MSSPPLFAKRVFGTAMLPPSCRSRVSNVPAMPQAQCLIARRRVSRGVAAVELAVVLPVLILLTLATTDFGRVIHGFIAVANAARCGAEYGAMHKFTPYTFESWQSQVREAVRQEMAGVSGFNAAELQIDIATVTDEDGLFRAKVAVSYPFRMIVNWPGLPGATMLNHFVEMRQIR